MKVEGESEVEVMRGRGRVSFGVISIPLRILEEIDGLIEDVGYWPSRSSFVREACLEKIKREKEGVKQPARKR